MRRAAEAGGPAMLNVYPLLWPLLRLSDAERAHGLAIAALRRGLVPMPPSPALRPRLKTRVWGISFANPIGLAAGFDKNAEVIGPLLRLGFGFVEVGTVTPQPQPGNPRPRLFRLPADHAVINRMGFNNDGMQAVAARLGRWREQGQPGIVGVNVGPNRDSADPVDDCRRLVAQFRGLADYLVVNVSSPNTPGLRDWQQRDALSRLAGAVCAARGTFGPPLLIKIAPDGAADERAAIAEVALAAGIDGLIATNTTIGRPPGLTGRHREQAGGLSGRPLFAAATATLGDLYDLTGGRLPLIGAGGVASGGDAYAKIRAGASLVQVYTALVYQGPWLLARLLGDLDAALGRDGFSELAAAVGADRRGRLGASSGDRAAAGVNAGTAP
jgi:dihydroorotate dehydrogenase